jgi:hypothetical protein
MGPISKYCNSSLLSNVVLISQIDPFKGSVDNTTHNTVYKQCYTKENHSPEDYKIIRLMC